MALRSLKVDLDSSVQAAMSDLSSATENLKNNVVVARKLVHAALSSAYQFNITVDQWVQANPGKCAKLTISNDFIIHVSIGALGDGDVSILFTAENGSFRHFVIKEAIFERLKDVTNNLRYIIKINKEFTSILKPVFTKISQGRIPRPTNSHIIDV